MTVDERLDLIESLLRSVLAELHEQKQARDLETQTIVDMVNAQLGQKVSTQTKPAPAWQARY